MENPVKMLIAALYEQRKVASLCVSEKESMRYHMRLWTLTMQNPPTFCIAVDAKRKIVFAQKQLITLYYWNKQSLTLGVEEVEYSSHKVRMTNAERSVCDAVRYRNKIGEDLCQEIIRTYLKRPDRKIGLMMEYAKALRVAKILGNYLNILME